MLKIIADDFGLHKSINDGIVFLLKENKIQGASLMPNGEEFDDAVKQSLSNQFSNIGIHLNLVEQKSVILGKPMPKNHRIFFIKYILGLIKFDFIQRELEAQILKVIQVGIKPAFINGNQHLHLLPGIIGIVIKLAQKYQIPYIRIVNETIFIPRSYYRYNIIFSKFFRFLQLIFLRFFSKLTKIKIKNAGLECNDFFVGFLDAGDMGRNDIKFAQELVNKYPDKTIELGCHPGYENNDLRIKYKHWGNYNWHKELDILNS